VALSKADFDFVRALIHRRAALVLEEEKAYLIESRLANLARREGFPSAADLVVQLRANRVSSLAQKVVQAMTTNETSFFRDAHPFEALRKHVLPDLIRRRAGTRRLHIWCAATSTGQEPYSVAMLLREHFADLVGWAVRITATDLSTDALARAREGRYSQLEIKRGLPVSFLVKYFTRQGTAWQLKDEVRRMVDFLPLNLIEAWPAMPRTDIVLMRNVLIYFDVETKKQILNRVRQLLQPDGYMFLGAAETTLNLDDHFERSEFERSGCYRLRRCERVKTGGSKNSRRKPSVG
jgi:chemotaxis protein methyltransferase CheR